MYLYAWMVVLYRSIVSLVGIPGNILILFVYKRRKILGSAQFFINALAIADLYVCFVSPLAIHYYVLELNYPSAIGCKVTIAAESVGWYTSVGLTLAVAADRYVAICRPLTGRWTRRKAANVTALCVVLAVLLALPEVYSATITLKVQRYFGFNYTACVPHGNDYRYTYLFQLPRFLTPLIALPILSVIYIKIWIRVRRQSRKILAAIGTITVPGAGNQGCSEDRACSSDKCNEEMRSQATTSDNQQKPIVDQLEPQSIKREVKKLQDMPEKRNVISRMTRMLLATTLIFSVTWLLSIILFSFKAFTDYWNPNGIAVTIVSVMRLCPVLNHAINPFVYSFTNKQFCRDCKNLLCK